MKMKFSIDIGINILFIDKHTCERRRKKNGNEKLYVIAARIRNNCYGLALVLVYCYKMFVECTAI